VEDVVVNRLFEGAGRTRLAQRAEAAAKKIEGVRSVKNDVRIKSSS